MPEQLKNYEVSVSAFARVVVIAAKDEEDALYRATERVHFGDFQMDEAKIHRVITDAEDLARTRRYADAIDEEN